MSPTTYQGNARQNKSARCLSERFHSIRRVFVEKLDRLIQHLSRETIDHQNQKAPYESFKPIGVNHPYSRVC
jgi:hypothetical protein